MMGYIRLMWELGTASFGKTLFTGISTYGYEAF